MQLKTVTFLANAALPMLVQGGYIALRAGEGQCYFQVEDIDSCTTEASYFGSSDGKTCVQGSSDGRLTWDACGKRLQYVFEENANGPYSLDYDGDLVFTGNTVNQGATSNDIKHEGWTQAQDL
ncbi:uncharacterized protein APUU_20003A [Aspergillus puulaauensis]|uniref:Uncharacterized protein n=1 Tax=Aspergillus puulaauensis TaxID=1220207 RepID=A0A7R8AHZ2_9EURO|nr:uncharacterized protein APUU_20003A [Aspergillus puulaauensis]BCS19571.1 hypothetical protein APUU_20003A [Aspergillus puulaauensis]